MAAARLQWQQRECGAQGRRGRAWHGCASTVLQSSCSTAPFCSGRHGAACAVFSALVCCLPFCPMAARCHFVVFVVATYWVVVCHLLGGGVPLCGGGHSVVVATVRGTVAGHSGWPQWLATHARPALHCAGQAGQGVHGWAIVNTCIGICAACTYAPDMFTISCYDRCTVLHFSTGYAGLLLLGLRHATAYAHTLRLGGCAS